MATTVSMCVFPVFWYDYTGGYTSDRHPCEQSFLGLRLPTDVVPSSPVKQYVPRSSQWWFMRWSVLSRVRVIADPAGCSLPGGGLSVGADVGWILRGSRCSAEHEHTPFTDAYGHMVVVMAAAPPGSQDAGCFRAHSPAIQAFLTFFVAFLGCHRGAQFCQYGSSQALS